MPRRRFGVALLLPERTSTEVYGLRKALGAPSLDRQPPHITLVPPINVHTDDVDDALAVLRNAAAHVLGPLHLTLGAPASFTPESPVLYLPVGGDDLERLKALREAVFVPPLFRFDRFEYSPHCTLHENVDEERMTSALAALASYRAEITVDALVLLEDDGDRVWRPLVDVSFGPPIVRGRGGVELHLRWSQRPSPDSCTLWASTGVPLPTGPWLEARAVTGALLAVRNDDVVVVADEHLGEGIEVRLLQEPRSERFSF
jgi:2'-5' RNA ligase